MCVSRSTLGDARCERSATPVSVGVNTSWPADWSALRTRFQHQLPCQAPCTRTNVVIDSPPGAAPRAETVTVSREPSARSKCTLPGHCWPHCRLGVAEIRSDAPALRDPNANGRGCGIVLSNGSGNSRHAVTPGTGRPSGSHHVRSKNPYCANHTTRTPRTSAVISTQSECEEECSRFGIVTEQGIQ